MEEGVVSEMLKGPLRDVFDHKQLITDVSGSGNNWYVSQGPKYEFKQVSLLTDLGCQQNFQLSAKKKLNW